MFDGQADEAMELGIQFEDFNRIYRGQKAKVFKGAAKKVISTLQWQDVNQLLQTAGPMSQNIEVSKEGQRLSPSAYMDATHGEPAKRISPSALNRAIADGHSIILNYLDTYHQPANELCSALTSALQEHVNLNAYISMVSNKCFTTHWDDHDVFIIQTQGRKHWSVFEPTRKFPLKHDVVCKNMPEGIDLFWEGELNQGDLLYIPRGWWHHASATDVGSIHITAGFSNRRPVHLLNFLVNEASEHEWMRMDLNRVGDRDHTDLLEKIARYFKD